MEETGKKIGTSKGPLSFITKSISYPLNLVGCLRHLPESNFHAHVLYTNRMFFFFLLLKFCMDAFYVRKI